MKSYIKYFGGISVLGRFMGAQMRRISLPRLLIRFLVALGCIALFLGFLYRAGTQRAFEYPSDDYAFHDTVPPFSTTVESAPQQDFSTENQYMPVPNQIPASQEKAETKPLSIVASVTQPDSKSPEKETEAVTSGTNSKNLVPKKTMKISKPMEADAITPFGWAYSPVLDQWYFHSAVDFGATEDTLVCSAAGGVVLSVESGRYGMQVTIDHGHDITTIYAGCKEIGVKPGDNVKPGEAIACIGKPGDLEPDSGPRLHFGVFVGGEAIDPQTVILGQ